MSTILYYSNFCEHSKKLLQSISKMGDHTNIHFICIDKREKDQNNKVFIVLENGQKMIMPENVNRVPALLLLSQNYNVLYGSDIINYFKPSQQSNIQQATQNNMEPSAFSFGSGGFGDIVSDNFSFLDQGHEDLSARGNGGTRQMHNYVDLNFSDSINTPTNEADYKNNKSSESSKSLTMEQLQQQREADLTKLTGNRPPPI